MQTLRVPALLLLSALSACSGDSPAGGDPGGGRNEPGPPATIVAVSGPTAPVPAATSAPAPLVVRVSDAKGLAVPNATVVFTPAAGSGSVSASSVATGTDGQAQVG